MNKPAPNCVRLVRRVAALLTLAATPISAQLFSPATVIRGAKIETMSGRTLERGEIFIKGERIIQIEEKVELSFADRFTAKSMDAEGKTVTPGLIDAWSSLGRIEPARRAESQVTAWDAFDRYDRHGVTEALANGVTTVFVAPGGPPGIQGRGVVIQLSMAADQSVGNLLLPDAALCIDLGSGDSATERLATYQALRNDFRKAIEYQDSLEEYEEELKQYLEDLEKRRNAPEKAPHGDKSPDGTDKPSPTPSPESPDRQPDSKPSPAPEKRFTNRWGSLMQKLEDEKRPEVKDPEKEGPSEKNGQDKKQDKKQDGLKKPTRPAYDGQSELLLKALNRQIPVRIEAHFSADILNAVELAREYRFDLLLQGATEAYLMADWLLPLSAAETKESVSAFILGPTQRSMLFNPGQFRRHHPANAAVLRQRGALVAIGGGGPPEVTRFLAQNAQLAASAAVGTRPALDFDWLRILTRDAAHVLRVENQLGTLRPGLRADLVIWDGDPRLPTTRPERVFVNGRQVYAREN